jgi:hypothetical protein
MGGNMTVTFAPGSFVVNYPIADDPTALRRLERLVNGALTSRLMQAFKQ